MAETIEPGTTCPACGRITDSAAATCTFCGAPLHSDASPRYGFADSDPALEHVDQENRVELARYDTDTGAEAEIDCGLLRANDIACELGGPTLPGLPSNVILWVNQQDADAARTLLAEVETSPDDSE
jgi:hypothetical protein